MKQWDMHLQMDELLAQLIPFNYRQNYNNNLSGKFHLHFKLEGPRFHTPEVPKSHDCLM